MSSFLCFICHSTVNADTNEEMREKYREIVGMNLCPDSHLCHICCHVMNRLWLFRSICLKRSLEYPVLFSEKGTLNLQRNDLEIHTVCFEDCEHYKSRNINSKYYNFTHFDDTCDSNEKYASRNEYVELEDERQEFDDLFNNKINCNHNDNLDEVHNEKENTNFILDHGFEGTCNDFAVNTNFNHEEDDKVEDTGQHFNLEDLESEKYDVYDEPQNPASDHEETYEDDTPIEPDQPKSPSTEANSSETIENQDPEQPIKKKKKNKSKKEKKKKDKNIFEKLILSVEEQKGELEAKRKDPKYIEAESKCYNCAIGFLFKDTYQAHMMRHEESNGEYQCSICGLRFATVAVLRAHNSLHAERHKCLECGAILRRRHRSTHACGRGAGRASGRGVSRGRGPAARRPLACALCAHVAPHSRALRTHMLKHLSRKFPCAQCGRSFSSPHSRRAHVRSHAASAPLWCACGAAFASKKGLRAHQKRTKMHAESSFVCPICSRSCPTALSLAAHTAAAHAQLRPHACALCPRAYATRKSLQRHVAGHTAPCVVQSALCYLCGRSFKGNSKLNRHLREVCEKDKLEEELSSYYAEDGACRLNTG